MNTSFIGFAVLAFLAIVLLIEAVYLFWNSRHGTAVKRMDERLRALSAGGNVGKEQMSILKQRLLSESPFVTRLLLRVPRVHTLDRQLQQAGMRWSVARFATYTLLCAVAGAVLGFLMQVPAVVMAVLAGVLSLLPMMILRRKRAKRVLQLERQLPDAADLIARALRAGHSFPAALGMVGEELPDPLGGEFALAFDEINYGVSMNDALLNMVNRVPVEDLRYFVIAVLIQREAGGNLAEILGCIAGIIRERLKLLGKVRVLSAEGRLSAWVLGVLPFAILGLLSVLNPGYITVFWKDPAGVQLAGIAITMMLFGILWMRKVVRIHI
ncbi:MULTISPECIES: type II secretion system F family protein [Paraburkholderia]|uniref:Tight adherence protein B n=1 Tax=Paraburkholderia aspalathi TaxID=1324617 RepID=A0A1I7E8W3_9BURK|nr:MULTISPECIES: type II secretion system F family protein [Paraburkholderia]MCX4139655.1 type II secretion system F family protein [Paraburkholderia aspalathi]MDN7172342.1 type II secretion system F family protein [Paraburkholderia sp. SEWSISQ10-3 4]MDQ6501981.1 type II secretion system F family protein [Paraburkholderia aspalathi]SFU20377.1 tight adherence protein B [Paraburkholderia aspalathi]